MNLRRINILGGAGTGKSTMAQYLTSKLNQISVHKSNPLKFQLVSEYIKKWTFDGRKVQGYGQHYVLGKQQYAEETCLLNGVDTIITDSPIMLSAIYGKSLPTIEAIKDIVWAHEIAYQATHILLNRGDRPYVQNGRWGTREDAVLVDDKIKKHLIDHNYPFVEFDTLNYDGVLEYVVKQLWPSQ